MFAPPGPAPELAPVLGDAWLLYLSSTQAVPVSQCPSVAVGATMPLPATHVRTGWVQFQCRAAGRRCRSVLRGAAAQECLRPVGQQHHLQLTAGLLQRLDTVLVVLIHWHLVPAHHSRTDSIRAPY
jgi:hypothetical protein